MFIMELNPCQSNLFMWYEELHNNQNSVSDLGENIHEYNLKEQPFTTIFLGETFDSIWISSETHGKS